MFFRFVKEAALYFYHYPTMFILYANNFLCSLTQQLDDIINRITHVSFVLILHAFMFHISCQFYTEEILKENEFIF